MPRVFGSLVLHVLLMDAKVELRLEERGEGWVLVGGAAARFELVNEYLSHLLDRNYSSATVRAYGYDLLAFCRWLTDQDLDPEAVTTNVLLDYLKACREASVPGRPGPNVVTMDGQRVDGTRPPRSTGGLRRSRRASVPGCEESGPERPRGPLDGLWGAVRDARPHNPPAQAPFGVTAA